MLRRPDLSRDDFWPLSLKSTIARDDDDDDDEIEEDGEESGIRGPHFFPRRPIERALASCMLYSTPSSVKSKDMLNLNFSGRFPEAGGANMRAYRAAAVELKVPVYVGVADEGEEERGCA